MKQIVGSTLAIVDDPASEDSVNGEDLNAGSSLVTNFVSEQSAAYFAKLYKSHKLKGGHVIALSKDEASEVEARKALGEYPGKYLSRACLSKIGSDFVSDFHSS